MTVRRSGPGIASLTVALRELHGLEAKVGWFESARYKDGTPVAYVAAIHEFGAVTRLAKAAEAYQAGGQGAKPVVIPPRPFMRPTVAAKSQAWIDLLGQGAKASLTGGPRPRDVLEMVALRAAGDIAKTIRSIQTPPLSPLTVARKGHRKPLVDTGQMIQSLTGAVTKG